MSADAPAVRDGTATLAGTALFTVDGFITVEVAVIADALGIRATRDRGRRVGLVIAHVPQCVDTQPWPLQRVAHG